MSHTNKTQYYELPQYVGSDIINPLTDTNGAYETIDTTMHNIATEVAQDSAGVLALQSKVGNGVFQTTAQNATDAVNEIEDALNTADTGIVARLTTAENDIDTIQSQMVTAQGNITDLQNNKANASDVSALKTTVGDANSGLVKDVDDIKNSINNSHVFKSIHRVSATKLESGDTISDLYDRLKTAIEAYLSALPSDNYAIPVAFGYGNGWEGSCKLSIATVYNHNTTLNDIFIDGVITVVENNRARLYEGRVGLQKRLMYGDIAGSGNNFIDQLQTEPTNDAYVDFMIFGKP